MRLLVPDWFIRTNIRLYAELQQQPTNFDSQTVRSHAQTINGARTTVVFERLYRVAKDIVGMLLMHLSISIVEFLSDQG